MIWFGGQKPDLAAMTAMGGKSMPGLLGIEFIEAGDDWVSARMPVDHRTHQPFGRLHGGASVALAETVASMGGAMTLDPSKQAMSPRSPKRNRLAAPRRSGRSASPMMPASWSACRASPLR